MKSLTAVCQTGASMPAMKPNGRITRHPRHNRADGENAEMKMYLSKLKDLVPFMPKRKLSKLEIIQHVIDYICDLQTELEAHPEIGNFDAATALNITNHLNLQHNDEDMLTPSERLAAEAFQQQHQLQQQQQQQSSQSLNSNTTRQPLADRSTPNTILPPSPSSTSSSSSNSSLTSATLTSASIITTTLLSAMPPVQSQIPLTNQTVSSS